MYIAAKHILILGLILLLGGTSTSAQIKFKKEMEEYTLKAAFVYRFIDYINWDKNTKAGIFKIAIIGKCPIYSPLVELTQKRKIDIKQYNNLNDFDSCNILFVPYSNSSQINDIINKFSGKQVLIITEKKGYGKKGAHINFIIVGERLKFEANLRAINQNKIEISSLLLQHAIIIK